MVRIKERYLLVNILYPPTPTQTSRSRGRDADVPEVVALHRPSRADLTPQSLASGIRSQVASLFGDYGSGATEGTLSVKYLSRATSTFILRARRAHYRLVWAALTTMTSVPVKSGDGEPCIFQVVRVSGTIRKVEEEAIRQARALILVAKSAETSKKGSAILPSGLHATVTAAAGCSVEPSPSFDVVMSDAGDGSDDDVASDG